MSLAARITRLPRPFDPDRAGEARALATGGLSDLADLLEGAGGCSPYLLDLLVKERDWLETVVDDPEAGFDALSHTARTLPPDQVKTGLREIKRRAALLLGLADLSGVWTLEGVTTRLTALADAATGAALRTALTREVARGKLPGMGEEDIATGCGMVALAMGKMGAEELNYSSDIDLICLFDETRFDRDDYHDARAALVRATRTMAATLSDQTAEGYVFRTDLRLRPDPAVTPVCMAMAAAEDYYESLGRTWERAAYIKARAAAGDIEAGARFLDTLTPFVWRKHLDFAAIRDAHDMRLRIREHKGLHGEITLPGHNMKLGRGGIREIEFFTQTRQLIAGGRDPDLRCRGTPEGLAALAEKGWVPGDVRDRLTAHYRAHREVEHRLQMLRDAQTHDLPQSPEGFERLAAFMGTDRTTLERDLRARLEEVHTLTEDFFAPDAARPVAAPAFGEEITARWTTYPALRSSRGVELFQRLKPEILQKLSEAAKPDEALRAFDDFLRGLPAGVQLFALFEANPHLIDLLVDVVTASPALAAHLSRNAQVFDAVIAGEFFADWPGADALTEELAARLAEEEDYERRLDDARRWGKEWHFRIGVHLLRGLIDAETAGRQYADLADAMLRALFPVVVAQFATRHGAPPGRGAVVLGMGSLGAARLTPNSDLDLIVIYDPGEAEETDGPRPLMVRPYFARLTQALVTAMTAPMSEGRLYEVDMRLRPSGNQGPVATSWASFQAYQRGEAWVWEHLALTRARAVAGEEALAQDVEAFRRDVLGRDGRDKVLAAVADMRRRIAGAKAPAGPFDAKIGPGRLQDIELLSQAGALLARSPARGVEEGLASAVGEGVIDRDAEATLVAAYRLCWQVQVATRLLTAKPLSADAEELGEAGRRALLALTGAQTVAQLAASLQENAARAAAIISAALPEPAEEERP